MAKSGFKHIDVGNELSKAEWESEESHELIHGTSFPSAPVERQLFYRDDEHKWYIYDGSAWVWLGGGGGSGDMLKSVYDTDDDGVVDNSEKLEGNTKAQVQDHTPKAHTLASHSSKAHSELTGVGTADHHVKYTDAEAKAQAEGAKLDDHAAPDDNTDLDATTLKHGLMPKADKSKLDGVQDNATKYPDTGEQPFLDADHAKLDGIAAGADVTGSNPPQAHKASHQDGGSDEISIAGLAGESAELASHKGVETAGVHGSASAATANKLVHRDANGRAAIAGPSADGDIDNKAARDSAISTHAALSTNVHGIQDVPLFTTATKTYYIDAINGDDSNGGESSGDAFKTWGKAETMIPMYLRHPCTIKIIGDLPEDIKLENRTIAVAGTLTITGNTTTPGNHEVTGIDIRQIIGDIRVNYLRSTGRIYLRNSLASPSVISCFKNLEPRSPSDWGIEIIGSNGYVRDCDFGTNVVTRCIVATNSRMVSRDNSGNGTQYGLCAMQSSVIAKKGTQPTGTTANEHTEDGGVIR